MNTEKTIKIQAKRVLEGNWFTVITAVVAVLIGVILLEGISSLIMIALNTFDMNTLEIAEGGTIKALVINFAMYCVMFLLSPVVNGVYKIVCDISKTGKSDITGLFYYFRNRKYFKTLRVNFLILVVFMFFSSIFNVYSYVSLVSDAILKNNPSFDIIIDILLVLSWIITAVLITLFYIVFVNYSMLAYAFDDSRSVIMCTFGMYLFSIKNLGAALKLVISFLGWIALCFFVVPAFYVFPYIMTSMAVSAKWLFALDKDLIKIC